MYRELSVPQRTIMTPGPVESEPRVLRAMSMPIIGQFDPCFLAIMDEVKEMLKYVFQTGNEQNYAVDGTSRSGMEALMCSLIEPGDKVLIPTYGRFGNMLIEIAERSGAEVHSISKTWGQVFTAQEVIEAIENTNPRIVAIVHGETSTGCMQPLEEIGKYCAAHNILFLVDAVATLGGAEFKMDEWCVDGVCTGTQKCLAVPTGMSPISYNAKVEKLITERKQVELGLGRDQDNPRRVQSNYLDLSQIQEYWGAGRLNHHTEATTMLYGLREGLRLIIEEGMDSRLKRHKLHETAIVEGVKAMGLSIFGDPSCKMPTVTCINVPEGLDGEAVRNMLLRDFSVEVAGAFGALKGKIWRVGTMGYSARKKNVLTLLSALEACIIANGGEVNRGEAIQAALNVYNSYNDAIWY
jgi:(S)-ureidoglycine-glyoxylate aminotransferase